MYQKQLLIIECAKHGLGVCGTVKQLTERLEKKNISTKHLVQKNITKKRGEKKKKDEKDKTERGPNAYTMFMQKNRKDVADSIGTNDAKSVMVELAKRWKQAKSQEKNNNQYEIVEATEITPPPYSPTDIDVPYVPEGAKDMAKIVEDLYTCDKNALRTKLIAKDYFPDEAESRANLIFRLAALA